MRLPRPVLIKPSANMKADTINQIVVLENPASASPVFMIPRMGSKVSAISAIAPMGIGCRIKPAIVAMKTANRPQAWAVTPAGAGINQMIAPIATHMRPRTRGLSPCLFESDISFTSLVVHKSYFTYYSYNCGLTYGTIDDNNINERLQKTTQSDK